MQYFSILIHKRTLAPFCVGSKKQCMQHQYTYRDKTIDPWSGGVKAQLIKLLCLICSYLILAFAFTKTASLVSERPSAAYCILPQPRHTECENIIA